MAGRCRTCAYLCVCTGAAGGTITPAAGGSRLPIGKPPVSVAADDRFAQFDVVGLTIELATKLMFRDQGRAFPSGYRSP
ncbi:MAG: hypothetical protein ACLP0J_05135 [Solirubrobacteraceae bacterium]